MPGIKKPSLKKKIAARTSLKRYIRHSIGLKAPKGFGVLTNPKKFIYNKVYNKTTVSMSDISKTPAPKCRICGRTLRSERTKQNGLCYKCEK